MDYEAIDEWQEGYRGRDSSAQNDAGEDSFLRTDDAVPSGFQELQSLPCYAAHGVYGQSRQVYPPSQGLDKE